MRRIHTGPVSTNIGDGKEIYSDDVVDMVKQMAMFTDNESIANNNWCYYPDIKQLRKVAAKLVLRLGVTYAEFEEARASLEEDRAKEEVFIEFITMGQGYGTENEAGEIIIPMPEPEKAGPKNVVLKHFQSYNHRRYSAPWVCTMLPNGNYDFNKRVGTYTGHAGDEGDLVIFEPVEGQVYGYGQKDTRGGNTVKEYVRYVNGEFIPCDKLGR